MALGKLAMRATCRIAAAVVCAALVAVGTSHSQDGDTAGGLTGRLLVATPDLRDPNFSRTVIYIVEDGPGGTIGFIVNRPLGAGPAARVLELFDLPGEGFPGWGAFLGVRIESPGQERGDLGVDPVQGRRLPRRGGPLDHGVDDRADRVDVGRRGR